MANLVIVESPSKCKSLKKYLGSNYNVLASKGHIRDLKISGKLGLGVDVDNDFLPTYEVIRGKGDVVKTLKKAVKESDHVYLASDPDREGEAISWHLKSVLDIPEDKYNRVTFNEITKDKVLEAFNNPHKIDEDLVRSQETRRILDRLIGFRLSKLMQSKTGGKSAGRVQSVAVKLIVDREREIEAFIPEEYWLIKGLFNDFENLLFKYKDKDIKVPTEEEADKIISSLNKEFIVESVEEKTKKRIAKFPFITSSLQQEASSKLGFNAKKTMMIAQSLYEGVDLGSETVGLITYMRTDSTRFSQDFIKSAFSKIEKDYGKDYVGYLKQSKKEENVQDAHEAIRPTNLNYEPDKIKDSLTSDQYKLYEFIYKRSLASLMSDAKVKATTVIFDNNNYKFKTTGQVLIFDGYLKIYAKYDQSEDKVIPDFKERETYVAKEITKEQHFTQPPARYTEAKLIKELDELGIGRPSTYATIVDTIQKRGYVKLEKKVFVPTSIGFETNDKLEEGFKDIINVEYTAQMESLLDDIAKGKDNIKVLRDFWDKFEPLVEKNFKEMKKTPPKETGEVCPECGSPLVVRKGRYGEFVACSNYPNCKYIKKEKKEEKIIGKCPKCKEGNIIEKKTRKGKIFYGCSNYPKCKAATWDLPTLELCPECSELLIEKDGQVKCSKCDYIKQ